MKLKRWIFLLLLLIPSLCLGAAADYKVDNLGNIYSHTLGIKAGTGAFYTLFQGGTQAGTVTYTLPDSSSTGLLKNTSGVWSWITDIPTAYTIGSAYIYRVGGTDVAVTDGGTGASTFALNGVLYGNAANAIGVTAIGAEGQLLRVGASPFVPGWTTATYPNIATTTGAYLRADGTNWISSTLLLPNAGTAYKLAAYTATNTLTELAAVGATGQYLSGVTGAIPVWQDKTSIDVRDYEAYNDGTHETETTAAVQAAVNAAIAGNKSVGLIGGTYAISSTITIANVYGLRFFGFAGGYQGVTFQWKGNNSTPMFLLQDVGLSTFENFSIACDGTNPLSIGIQSENGSGVTVTPTNNTFRKITMQGVINYLGKGFAFVGTGAGGDSNNDQCNFEDVNIYNYLTAAWSFEHSQSKNHLFKRCSFQAYGNGTDGLYGVTTALGAGAHGGSFSWYSGNGVNNVIADFYLGTPNETVIIDGFNSENSGSLLVSVGAGSAYYPINIRGVRFAMTNGHFAADNKIISFLTPGPLILTGNTFEDYITGGGAGIIYMSSTTNPGELIALGNYIETTAASPFSTNGTVYKLLKGNYKLNKATSVYSKIDDIILMDGTITIGTLTGLIKGTAGLLSAITATTSADYLGGDFAVHTLNQAAVAGLTTASGPTFAHLHLSDLAAITTAAESWIGPSSTTGMYFKGGLVGIGFTAPLSALCIDGGLHVGGESAAGDNNLLVDGTAIFTGGLGAETSMGGYKITSLATPTAATDAATKAYVDAIGSGLQVKVAVRVATTTVLPACTAVGHEVGKTLTADAVGILTIDGVATALNDRILVKDQATGADNGIYLVTTEGTAGVAFILTRATDADTDVEVLTGMYCFVTLGTVNGNSGWILITPATITLDTTALTFTLFSQAVASATYSKTVTFTVPGTLATGLNAAPSIIVTRPCTIIKAYAHARTVPTGSAINIDINSSTCTNASTCGTPASILSATFSIDVSDNYKTTTSFGSTALIEHQRLDIDIDQVGSTVPGADLTVEVEMICT